MVGSLGSAKHAGMSGFDWVTYKNLAVGIDASFLDDFIFDEAPTDPADIALQRFESVEGLSGTRFNDRLTGGDFTAGTGSRAARPRVPGQLPRCAGHRAHQRAPGRGRQRRHLLQRRRHHSRRRRQRRDRRRWRRRHHRRRQVAQRPHQHPRQQGRHRPGNRHGRQHDRTDGQNFQRRQSIRASW